MRTELTRDLRTLALFINLYCRHKHPQAVKQEPAMKTHDIAAIAGRKICVCDECMKLLMHAYVKRSSCPMDPKPMCKACPNHCYHPTYRMKIQEVMRFSGRKMMLSGRLDYLLHLLF